MDDNTGGGHGEVRMVGTTLVVTLHVELVWTDLEDFAEHYKRALRGHEARDLLMQPPGLYWRLWGDEPCPEKLPFEGWDILGDTGRFVRVLPVPVGSTGMTYYVVQGTLGQEHRIMFAVSALRYRRDRLRVYLAENQQCEHHADGTIVTKWPQGAPVYGAAMLDWLLRNWGEDGVRQRPPEDAPPMPSLPEPMPLLPTRATPDQWYDWFDWYYRQAWGRPHSINHMAELNAKSVSQNHAMHAQYMAAKHWP